MPEKIDSLLVELGLDADKRSFENGVSMFNNVRSAAMQFATAIGAGVGLNELTFGFAQTNDRMGKFADNMQVSAQFVDSLGFALARSGGNAEDAFGSIETMVGLFDDLRMGRFGALEEAARFGLDPRVITEAQDTASAFERLADATSQMSPQARRGVLEPLGFGSQAELTLFSSGADALRDYFARAEQLSAVTGEMTESAAEFQDEMKDLREAFRGLTNEISLVLLPSLSQASDRMTEFLVENRGGLVEFLTEGPEEFGRRYGEAAREWIIEQLGGLQMRGPDGPMSLREALEDLPSMPSVESPTIRRGQGGGSVSLGEALGGLGGGGGGSVSPELLDALAIVESGGRHRDASGNLITNPSSGARGKFQILPETGRDPGFGVQPLRNDTEAEHRRFAGDYLSAMLDLFGGDLDRALAAYNFGPGNVSELGDDLFRAAPEETLNYVPRVREELDRITSNQEINIEINGAQDPQAVAREVDRRLRQTANQTAQDFSTPIQ